MPTDCAKELWPCPTPLFRCRTRTPEGPLCWDMKRDWLQFLVMVCLGWDVLKIPCAIPTEQRFLSLRMQVPVHTLFGTNIEWHREHDFQSWTIVTWLVAYIFSFFPVIVMRQTMKHHWHPPVFYGGTPRAQEDEHIMIPRRCLDCVGHPAKGQSCFHMLRGTDLWDSFHPNIDMPTDWAKDLWPCQTSLLRYRRRTGRVAVEAKEIGSSFS